MDFADGSFDTGFVYIQVSIGSVASPRLVSLRGFGASGLHGFGTEVDSCVYAGNGVGDIGYMIFNFPFAIILITHTGERGGSETFRD